MGKAKGGNSHDRAVHFAKLQDPRVFETPELLNAKTSEEARKLFWAERFLRFVDSGATQTLVGLVGGLAGTFLDGRYFSCLSLLVSFGLYRSNALAHIRTRYVMLTHVVAIATASIALFRMGVSLNKSRPETFTPAQYAEAVKGKLPFPITQQITNIYNSYSTASNQPGDPRIDVSEFFVDGRDDTGTHFHSTAVNNGAVPALDVKGTSHTLVAVPSIQAEGDLFDFLKSHVGDPNQPTSDRPPGQKYETIEPVDAPPFTDEELTDLRARRKYLFVGRIDSYRNAQGKHFQTEVCMYWDITLRSMYYCKGHNSNRMQH